MKKNITTTFILLLAFLSINAQQVPYGFNYQSIVRDAIGLPIVNTQVKLRISVIQTNVAGNLVYQEEQTQTTNQFGLVNLIIGKGLKVGGSATTFSFIDWASDNFFIQVEVFNNNSNSWVSLGITQFQSVPYSLSSDNTLKLQNQKISPAAPAGGQFLIYNGVAGQWEPGNLAGANGGTVTTVTALGPLFISGNGGVNPGISILQAGPGQDGYLSGTDWAAFNKKLDVLSIAGGDIAGTYKTITVTGIQNTPVNLNGITTGDVLQYNGTAFVPFNIPAGVVPTSITGSNNLTVIQSGQSFTIPGLTTNTLGVSVNGNDIQIATATGTSYGLLNPADYVTFLNKLSTATGFGGDVTGAYSSLLIKSIAGVGITTTGASLGQALIYDGTGFSPQVIPGSQSTSLTGINGATVTGGNFSYTIDGQNLIAGSNVTISGNTINVAPPTPYTPLTSITGLNGITVSGTSNDFTITGPASVAQQYTSITGVGTTVLGFGTLNQTIIGQNLQAGSGITITGNQIINSSPNVPVTLTGTGTIAVTGTNNNYTISGIVAQTVTLTGTNGVTVLGTGLSQTIAGQNLVAGNGIDITGNTISGITTNAWLLGGNTASGINSIGTSSNFDLPFITNNTEAMRITSQGDVLVNTPITLAGARFEINGAATSGKASMAIMGGAGNSANLVFGRSNIDGGIGVAGSAAFFSSLANPGDIIVRAAGAGNSLILSSKGINGTIIFSTYNSSVETEKMAILNDGTVRIASLTSTGIGYVVSDIAGNLSITSLSATSIIGIAIPVIQAGNIFTIDGTNLLQTTSASGGDISGTFNSLSIKSIAGIGITTTGAALGQALIYDGVGFNPQTIPGNQSTTLTGINGATVTGSGFSYTVDGQNLTAGSNVTISGNAISVASPTPLASLTGANGITVSGVANNFTITAPVFTSQSTTLTGINGATVTGSGFSYTVNGQNLTAGSNVTISGNAISVASPTPLTSLTGANGITVSGVANNFTITAPVFTSQSTTLTGINGATVTGSGFSYTVDGQNLTAGSNVTISGNAISVASPTPLTSLTGINGITVSGIGNNFTITGTNNTQWQSSSANQIYTNSLVGIGLINPQYQLHISSTSGAALRIDDNTGNAIAIGSKGNVAYLETSGGLQIKNNVYANTGNGFGGTVLTIDPSGNVGIGANSPNQLLTVQGNSSISGIGYFGTIIGNNLAGAAGSIVTVDGFGKLGTGTFSSSQWNNTVGGVIYYNNGNVGIGTNAPFGQLGVVNTVSNQNTGFFQTNNVASVAATIYANNNGDAAAAQLVQSKVGGTATALVVLNSGSGKVADFSGTGGVNISNNLTVAGLSGAAGSVVTVNGFGQLGIGAFPNSSQWVTTTAGTIYYGGGKVGIGTIVPSSDLHIYNAGTGSSLKIESSSAPDYAQIVLQSDAQIWTTTLHGSSNGSGNAGEYLLYDNTAGATRFRVLPSSGNVVIGNFSVPANERLTVEGNATILGIGYADAFSASNLTISGPGYFGTIIGNNLAGAAGSIVTVDGFGKLGIGTIQTPQSQWNNTTTSYNTGIVYPGSFVGIGGVASANNDANIYIRNTTSDPVILLDGSGFAVNPALNFWGNINDGAIFLDVADNSKLKFASGNPIDNYTDRVNNTRMTIDPSGKVGIGTSSPNQLFTVQGNSSVSGIGYFGTIIGNNLVGAAGSIITVDGLGKLGIGTLPNNTSQWVNTINGIYYTTSVGVGGISPFANTSLSLKSFNSSGIPLYVERSATTEQLLRVNEVGNGMEMWFYGLSNSVGVHISTDPAYPTYFTNNIGLGTTTPNQQLSVIGNTSVTGIGYFGTIIGNNLAGAAGSIVTVDGLGQLGLGTLAANISQWNNTVGGIIYLGSGVGINAPPQSAGGLTIGISGAYDLDFVHGANLPASIHAPDLEIVTDTDLKFFTNGYNERMRITAGANVGIGTSAPNQTLAVVGNSSITGTGYFGTIIGNNLAGAAGSIVTVDGFGQLGTGALPSGSQWQNNGQSIYYNTSFVGIGTATPSVNLEVNDAASSSLKIRGGTGAYLYFIDNGAPNIDYAFQTNGADFILTSSNDDYTIGSIGLYAFSQTDIHPFSDVSYALGTINKRWSYLYTDNASITGLAILNNVNVNGILTLSGLAGNNAGLGVNASGEVITIGGNNQWTISGNNLQPVVNNDINISSITGVYRIGGYEVLKADGSTSNLILGGAGNPATITGTDNNFMGYQAGYNNTAGKSNNFLGRQAGFANTIGQFNNFLGEGAGQANNAGSNNNFMGYQAGNINTSGSNNNFFGIGAGGANILGTNNNFFGQYAGSNNTDGSNNIFIGPSAGQNNTSGQNNIALGNNAGFAGNSYANAIAIGANATVGGNNMMALGAPLGSGYEVNVGVGTSTPTNTLHVVGGARIENLSILGAGAMVTVDGLGNLGVGAMPTGTSQWTSVDPNTIYFNGTAVGIGTTTPTANLQIEGLANKDTKFEMRSVFTTTPPGVSRIVLGTYDATFGRTDNNQTLGTVEFEGYDTGSWKTSAYIAASSTQAYTGGAGIGSQLSFYTTQNGITTPAERIRINNDGTIMISNLAGAAGSIVTVDGTGTLGIGTMPAGTSQWIDDVTPGISYSAGNVAIGLPSSSPDAVLDIYSNVLSPNPAAYLGIRSLVTLTGSGNGSTATALSVSAMNTSTDAVVALSANAIGGNYNIAAMFSAKGGINNYGLAVPDGNVAIGSIGIPNSLFAIASDIPAYATGLAYAMARVNYNLGSNVTPGVTSFSLLDVSGNNGGLFDFNATVTGLAVDVSNITGNSQPVYAAVFNGGNVGIGTSDPQSNLHIENGSFPSDTKFEIRAADNPSYTFTSRILLGNKTLKNNMSENGERLGRIEFEGKDQSLSTWFTTAYMEGVATENYNTGGNGYGSLLSFYTTANATSTPIERLRINNDGTVTVNNLAGASGSVVTVDGLGNLGVGAMPTGSSQWTSVDPNTIYFNGTAVGIGTTTPSYPLEIVPASNVSFAAGAYYALPGQFLMLKNNNSNESTGLIIRGNATSSWSMYTDAASDKFVIGNLDIPIFGMSVDASANVVIGQSTGSSTTTINTDAIILGSSNFRSGYLQVDGAGNVSIGSGGGTTYTAGADIDITSNIISSLVDVQGGGDITVNKAGSTYTVSYTATPPVTYSAGNSIDLTSNTISLQSIGGDISGSDIGNVSVNKIKGYPVVLSSLTAGDVLSFDGANFINAPGSSGGSSQWTGSTDIYYTGGNVGIGTSTPVSTFSVGSANGFQVDASGNIVQLNGAPVSFPGANTVGFLANDGSGNITWAPAGSVTGVGIGSLPAGTFPLVTYQNTSTINPVSASIGVSVDWNNATKKLVMNRNGLLLGFDGDVNHQLIDDASLNGPILYGYTGGGFGVSQGSPVGMALFWIDKGGYPFNPGDAQVAINSSNYNDVTATLDVNGDARIRNLTTAGAGAIVTVDGLGHLGVGIMSSSGGLSGSGDIGGLAYYTGANTLTSNGANLGWDGTTLTVNGIQMYIKNDNFIVGSNTGAASSVGSGNNIFGYYAGSLNTSGNQNNFLGSYAGKVNTSGQFNNFIGNNTGYSNTTGSQNNFIGYLAGYSNSIGTRNDFMGYRAGFTNYDGNYNVAIGFQSGPNSGSLTNTIAIGKNATPVNNNSMALGGTGVDALSVGIGTGAPTATLHVVGGARIENLSIAGAVLTVDGLGNIGMGTLAVSSTSWQQGGNSVTGVLTTVLGTTSNDPIGFYTNGTEKMRLTPSGGLGINTTTVGFGSALEVTGFNGGAALKVNTALIGGSPYAIQAINNQSTQYTIQSSNAVSGGGAALFSNTNVSGSSIFPVVKIAASSTVPGYVALEVQGGIRFDNFNTAGSVLTVDGLGNIGMGTLATSADLFTISGNNLQPIGAYDINVTTFSGGYKLGGVDVIRRYGNNNSIMLGGAGSALSTGDYNIFVGSGTGGANTTGYFNNFIGRTAGVQNTTGSQNNYIGNGAGFGSVGASFNNALGYLAGYSNANGSNNNYIGYQAGFSNLSGGNNNYIGYQAGYNSDGSGNIAIGTNADIVPGFSNSIAIGNNITASGGNMMVIGGNITGLGINISSPTAMLDVNGSLRIRNLTVAGSVLTIDGLGNIGLGIMSGAGGLTFAPPAAVNSLTGLAYYTGANTISFAGSALQWDNLNQRLNIGGTPNINGQTKLSVVSDQGDANIFLYNVSNISSAGYLVLGRGKGNLSAITAVQANDQLGGVGFGGYDGTSIFTSGPQASIEGVAAENYSSIANGAKLVFRTTSLGGVNATTRMSIEANGQVAIGVPATISSNAALQVNSGGGTRGLLLPQITTGQQTALTSSLTGIDAGMIFYNLSTNNVIQWDGSSWNGGGGSGNNYYWEMFGTSVTGALTTVTGGFKIGTQNNYPFGIAVNGQTKMNFATVGGISIGMNTATTPSALQVNGDVSLGDGTNTGNKPVTIWLTNSNGSSMNAGDIVVVGTVDNSFNSSITASDNSVVGVLYEACASGSSCRVAISGVVTVNIVGTGVTRGQHCVTSTTSGQATSTPVPTVGASIGVYLETQSSGTARVLLR